MVPDLPGDRVGPLQHGVDSPLHFDLRTSCRAITGHYALRTDLSTAHRLVGGIDDVLAADLELHSTVGPTRPLDAKGARAERQDVAVAGNAVGKLG